MVQIRPYCAGDFAAVERLLCQLWPDKPLDADALHLVLDHGISTGLQDYLCAVDGEEVIGFGSLSLKNNLWQGGWLGHVDELIVDVQCRGRGVGRELLTELVALATARGCRRVELDSGMHRTEAHRFYESMGFECRGLVFSRCCDVVDPPAEQRDTSTAVQLIGAPLPEWTPPPLPSREAMEGRFCRVVPLDHSQHADSLYVANAVDREGRMWTYLPYGPFASQAVYSEWVGEMSGRGDPLFFAIVDRALDRPVGVASYLRIDPPNGSIEVGHLAYSPLLQRTPAATEAMYLMMERAFSLGYRRYEWKCDAFNAPSRAAAERLGFTFEGVFRQVWS